MGDLKKKKVNSEEKGSNNTNIQIKNQKALEEETISRLQGYINMFYNDQIEKAKKNSKEDSD